MFRLPIPRFPNLQRRLGVRLLSNGRSLREEQSEISAVSDVLQKSVTSFQSANDDKARSKAFASVQAAYGKLETLIVPPSILLQQVALSYQLPMVLGTVNDLGIAEVLSESTEPMTSQAIEKRCGLPANKVSRFLRFLTSRGIFKEVAPDIWAHTEASRLLDSGLPYDEIVKDPIHRFAKGRPVPAWISHTVEQGGMAAISMVTAFRDERYKKSDEVTETAFTKIYDIHVPFWEWLENEGRAPNVAKAFELNNARNFDFSYYPWHELPEGSTIVDVGGGVGSAMTLILPLAPKDIKVVIQDLSTSVLEGAKAFWNERDPNLIPDGRVVLQRHDFFEPQPIKGAAVYFMRFVLHDWKDDACVEIMKRLHDAASSTSRLLVVEAVVPHACHDIDSLKVGAVEGAYPDPMPHPLPANGGRASEFEASFDMHMLNILNGGERTYEQFKRIADHAGWKPTKVYQTDELSSLKILELVKL